MNRIANIAFAALASCILLAPAGNFAYSLLTGKVPKSELEGRKRPELIPVTWKTIAGDKVQSAFDAALAFSAPQRDNALLLHAKWQRKLIRFAALPFGFDIYPTYYGSQFAHDHGRERIMRIPEKVTRRVKKSWKEYARHHARTMRAHPKVRWFFAIVDKPGLSTASPFHSLVNNRVNYATRLEYLRKRLRAHSTVINLGYKEGENIYDDYHRTDDHWRIQGAVRAYKKIAYALGITPIKFAPSIPVTREEFWGNFVRRSLDADIPSEAIYDAPYKRSKLFVKVNGKPVPESFLNYGYSGLPFKKESKFAGMYSEYFHGQRAEIQIINKSIERGILLIIGDSYTHCMERFFAESYRKVYKLDPREMKGTLTEFLRSHKVDDVLILPSYLWERQMLQHLI